MPDCLSYNMIKFPHNFLWGAATSSYQVEGDNVHSDWWEWEKRVGLKESSGEACRHYQFFREDFDLAKALRHNAHRFSLEWSRIQPEENRFCEDEIEHYREVVKSLRERNIEPIITLHHFTNPLWFARLGGWENKKAVPFFLEYVRRVTEGLGDQLRYWVTINEPMVYIYYSYLEGSWPPQKKSFLGSVRVFNNLALAHVQAYKLIHSIYERKKWPFPLLGIAQNMQAFKNCQHDLKNIIALKLREKLFNFRFMDILFKNRSLDYLGINYYTRGLIDAKSFCPRDILFSGCPGGHSTLKKNSLGWDIYPQGIYEILLKLKRYGMAVLILENGICTSDDAERWDFIREHLKYIHQAIEKGVKVAGYIYWSLLDNYEWDKGFGARFGLTEVDYRTYVRTPRESAKKFASVCATGTLHEND
ncbi:MAG: glycoside hydrolase family 1 protein [Candidatus Omnitrophota bacterium]